MFKCNRCYIKISSTLKMYSALSARISPSSQWLPNVHTQVHKTIEKASDFRGRQVKFKRYASHWDWGVTAGARAVCNVAISRDLQRCQDWTLWNWTNHRIRNAWPHSIAEGDTLVQQNDQVSQMIFNFWISKWVELGIAKYEDIECISSWKCTNRRERRHKMQNLPRKVQESASKEQNPVKCPSQRRRSIRTNSS